MFSTSLMEITLIQDANKNSLNGSILDWCLNITGRISGNVSIVLARNKLHISESSGVHYSALNFMTFKLQIIKMMC